MNRILERIAQHARHQPNQPALADGQVSFNYADLQGEIERLSDLLTGQRIALLLANGCAWAVLDLAILRQGATCIPLPPFFSDAQLRHVLTDARPDLIITDQPRRLTTLLQATPTLHGQVAGRRVAWFSLPRANEARFPPGTAKLTYTSGTTGHPKGVCLSATVMARVTLSLSAAVQAGSSDRALSLLPLSTLLENIGGLYAPLFSGAQASLPDLAECGMTGSSGVDPAQLMATLHRFNPSSIILVPQLLKVMVNAAQAGAPLPPSLRFVAVGGARTAPALIEQARSLGLPVYEGYGLSEASSVVSLNHPGADRVGSVGRPLPHLRVRIDADGEVVVSGDLFSGYLGQSEDAPSEWRTGDLGPLDADGYLFVTGRKCSAFATAYGRNVSPEWVESELLADPALLQAAVFGEGRPHNSAVLVPHPRANATSLSTAIVAINDRLPDYARIRRWIVADAPFSLHNGLANAAGVINRHAIGTAYAAHLETLDQEETNDALV